MLRDYVQLVPPRGAAAGEEGDGGGDRLTGWLEDDEDHYQIAAGALCMLIVLGVSCAR